MIIKFKEGVFMMTYQSSNSLYRQKECQEIILINGMDKEIEAEFERFNRNARMAKKADGYFYNTSDKNIYLNKFAWAIGGGGHNPMILIDYYSDENKLKFETAAKRSNWLPIYEHTKFLINSNDGSAWFSFQFLPKESHYLARPFAIISAENPFMGSPDETLNEASNEIMRNTLKDLGYEFYQSIGELSDHAENSFIIYNIDKNKAIELGQEFQQESIVFNNGESICILKCATKESILSFEFKDLYI